jgi:Fe-S-cluster-containing dehydrogenase component
MSAGTPTRNAKAILTDVTLCIGCERCVQACNRQNKLPVDIPARYKAEDGLSGRRYTSIVRIPGRRPGTFRSVRRQCMHCIDPSCAAACLVGAFTRTPDGAVVYDDAKCIGCRYCMLACPFMIPRYEYDQPLPYIRKCKMNEDCRVAGGMPACVSACPTGATVFGPRDALLHKARQRIQDNPGRYVDHVYGERDFGGTSVIYISDIPLNDTLKIPSREELERWRVPQLATQSVPSQLTGWVMVTPFQFLTVSAGLAGLWIIRRRMRLMGNGDEEGDQSKREGDR